MKNSNYQLYGDNELSERIFFKAPVGIYIAQDGKFRFVNPAFLKIAGYQKDELLGADSLKLVFPEDRDRVRKNVLEMLKGGNPSPYLFRAVAKNGDLSWGIETVTSVQYEGRRAILGYFMDNTKLKRAEEENRDFKLNSTKPIESRPLEPLPGGSPMTLKISFTALLDMRKLHYIIKLERGIRFVRA